MLMVLNETLPQIKYLINMKCHTGLELLKENYSNFNLLLMFDFF
jgi:hypothetical protein